MTLDLTKLYRPGDPANIEGGGEAGIYWVGEDRLHGWFTFGSPRLLAAWFPDGSVKAGIETPRLLPPRPWYPDSWLDKDGQPLPGVHEHVPGTWPKCGPGDFIEALRKHEQNERKAPSSPDAAHWFLWADYDHDEDAIVAYRVLSEGEQ